MFPVINCWSRGIRCMSLGIMFRLLIYYPLTLITDIISSTAHFNIIEQVANYINGGHYSPHHDYVYKEKDPDHVSVRSFSLSLTVIIFSSRLVPVERYKQLLSRNFSEWIWLKILHTGVTSQQFSLGVAWIQLQTCFEYRMTHYFIFLRTSSRSILAIWFFMIYLWQAEYPFFAQGTEKK